MRTSWCSLYCCLRWLSRHKQWSLAKKVLVGLVMGVVFGLALHTIYGSHSVLKDSVQWFNIVGNGYVQLLQMIVMPLVFALIGCGCPSA